MLIGGLVPFSPTAKYCCEGCTASAPTPPGDSERKYVWEPVSRLWKTTTCPAMYLRGWTTHSSSRTRTTPQPPTHSITHVSIDALTCKRK
jgi:hypothetical protein